MKYPFNFPFNLQIQMSKETKHIHPQKTFDDATTTAKDTQFLCNSPLIGRKILKQPHVPFFGYHYLFPYCNVKGFKQRWEEVLSTDKQV